jgi:integrating conjugative element protein (TIGR03765 family)
MNSRTRVHQASLLLGLLTLHLSTRGLASLNVIFDNGQTQSIAPYFNALQNPLLKKPLTQQNTLPRLSTDDLTRQRLTLMAHALPVATPELTPGALAPQTASLPFLERPIFVIGADPLSQDWLQRYRQRLLTLKAIGLVVNVQTEAQFSLLKQLGAPLELVALSGASLASQFGFRHYPALISKSRIEQ